jgi:hypothetical protein
MNIKQTFLLLTDRTYPYGNEPRLRKFLPKNSQRDKHGNYFYKIGNSKTIFTCHLDTVSKKYESITHVIDGKYIRSNGTTILGADDKAGMCVLLYMIEQNIPGVYYFFIGEEVGCIGSKAAAAVADDFVNYDRIISFDRRDTCSVITHQSWIKCCSDEFANALCKQYNDLGLELIPDDTGGRTDSAQFTEIIPECTNISAGYYKEHTHEEHQDIEYLEKLCMASAIINWEELPIVRNPKVVEYKEYESCYYQHQQNIRSLWNDDDDYEDYSSRRKNWRDKKDLKKTYGYANENFMDKAIDLDFKSRKELKIITKGGDIFLTYRDYMSNRHITAEEYGIIEEQYIDTYLV